MTTSPVLRFGQLFNGGDTDRDVCTTTPGTCNAVTVAVLPCWTPVTGNKPKSRHVRQQCVGIRSSEYTTRPRNACSIVTSASVLGFFRFRVAFRTLPAINPCNWIVVGVVFFRSINYFSSVNFTDKRTIQSIFTRVPFA